MKTFHGALCGLVFALTFLLTVPASAEVVINNVFSPFSVIRVRPAYGIYTPPPILWINDPTRHQRCYRRWLPYFGEWHWHCVRMHGVY